MSGVDSPPTASQTSFGHLSNSKLSVPCVSNPYFLKKCSNSVSELTVFNPATDTLILSGIPNNCLATYYLPLPGPPAIKTAFRIPLS